MESGEISYAGAELVEQDQTELTSRLNLFSVYVW
jgi:hypothetical protein